jgi:hypothetical protein
MFEDGDDCLWVVNFESREEFLGLTPKVIEVWSGR